MAGTVMVSVVVGGFNPPEGATRPAITMAPYPAICTPAGQTGSIAISFDVNPNGVAENLHIEKSSDPALESEGIRIVRGWQFRPGMKDGQPVCVPCTMDFAEGLRSVAGDKRRHECPDHRYHK